MPNKEQIRLSTEEGKTKDMVRKGSKLKKTPISRQELFAKFLADVCLSKKSYDVVIIDIRKHDAFTDLFVLCTVGSDRQARAVSNAVLDEARKLGEKPSYIEASESTWIVQDYIDVVVHIFTEEKRKFYNLERLWGDGECIRVLDKKEKAKNKSGNINFNIQTVS